MHFLPTSGRKTVVFAHSGHVHIRRHRLQQPPLKVLFSNLKGRPRGQPPLQTVESGHEVLEAGQKAKFDLSLQKGLADLEAGLVVLHPVDYEVGEVLLALDL